MSAEPESSLALVAVQVSLDTGDASTPHGLRSQLEQLGQAAAQRSSRAGARLLVFPAGIGMAAALLHLPAEVRRAPAIDEAVRRLVRRQPLRALAGLLMARSLAPQHALWATVLPAADAWVRATFAAIARRHRATVVAGSVLRPGEGGTLVSTSYTFDPEGRLRGAVDKVNRLPTVEDGQGGRLRFARGTAEGQPVVHLPWGSLGTLVDYDGFVAPHTRVERFAPVAPVLAAAGATVLANPAAHPWPWHERFCFAPAGCDLSWAERWRSHGLAAALGSGASFRYGITAHSCGHCLGHEFSGVSQVLAQRDGRVTTLAEAESCDRSEVVCAVVSWPSARQESRSPLERSRGASALTPGSSEIS